MQGAERFSRHAVLATPAMLSLLGTACAGEPKQPGMPTGKTLVAYLKYGEPLTEGRLAAIASAPRNSIALILRCPADEPARIISNDPGDLGVTGR